MRCWCNRATKIEMDREWIGVKKGELLLRFEWVVRTWKECLWSVGFCPVAGTGERDSDSVGDSRNKRRTERLALVKNDFAVCIYRRFSESHSTLLVLADEEPSEVGGCICPVREVARNGWYLLCFIAECDVPSSYWRLSPNISRENVTGLRKRVLVFRDLTLYSLVFHEVSKEANALISRD